MENADNGGIVWSDRKRIAFGLPWTFTKYTLTKEKLLIHTGMLNTQEDEVRLYRIMDVTLRRSLWERMFGLGTIHCCSADKSTPEFDIAWVKDAAQVKETLSDMVEAERMAKRVSSREFMTDDEDGEMQIDIYKDTFVRLNPMYWEKKRLHKHNPYDRKTQHQKQNPF